MAMMRPERLENGKLLVPARVEGPDGLIGDGLKEIGIDDPAYPGWEKWMAEHPAPEDQQADAG
jgi:hypothetical protein